MQPARVEGTVPPNRRNERRSGGLWAVVAIVAAIIAGIWIWSAYRDRAGVGEVASLGEVAENPSAFAGERVTLAGEVDRTLAQGSFTLQAPDGMSEILVVNQTGEQLTLTADAPVTVTGEVRVFNREELQQDVGYSFDDPLFEPWEGKAVLLANTVSTAVGSPTEGARTPPPSGEAQERAPQEGEQQRPGTEPGM